jgi:hypothetical protein
VSAVPLARQDICRGRPYALPQLRATRGEFGIRLRAKSKLTFRETPLAKDAPAAPEESRINKENEIKRSEQIGADDGLGCWLQTSILR